MRASPGFDADLPCFVALSAEALAFVNETRAASWRGAFVTKPVGGYGYSGWIWETVGGRFRIKQGPKLLSVETSRPG